VNNAHSTLFSGNPGQYPVLVTLPDAAHSDQVKRVLRNTYALLAMTLLFSAGVAVVTLTLQLPAPSLILTLVGYFGLLYAVFKVRNSTWALPTVFALTGFMGYTLGPLLTHSLALPGGAQIVTLALAATGATFLALSSYVLLTRRDCNFVGGFLFVGMVIALIAGIAAVYLQMQVLGLAVSAMVAFLSANLFTSLLSVFGFSRSNE
jgi:modulator of FtsH protease